MAAHKAPSQHPESLTAVRTDAKVVPLARRRDREPSSLTIPEVMAELQVSRSTFYYWRQTGKAPRCIKLPNGEIRVRRTDLDRWLDSLEEAA
jgi:predicted DNA-binding transcriptional regulator AlpA